MSVLGYCRNMVQHGSICCCCYFRWFTLMKTYLGILYSISANRSPWNFTLWIFNHSLRSQRFSTIKRPLMMASCFGGKRGSMVKEGLEVKEWEYEEDEEGQLSQMRSEPHWLTCAQPWTEHDGGWPSLSPFSPWWHMMMLACKYYLISDRTVNSLHNCLLFCGTFVM